MRKTFIGPQLRKLRREHKQTQAEMAKALGVSAGYVNLLENNQRTLSVQVLMALSDAFGVDWRDLIDDESSATRLTELRAALQDPIFGDAPPDLQELRAALDHAPQLVGHFLQLYRSHRTALNKILQQGDLNNAAAAGAKQTSNNLLTTSPEAIIHDFFRNHRNHFARLETAAEAMRLEEPFDFDDAYAAMKSRLRRKHGATVRIAPTDEMGDAIRIYDRDKGELTLSAALDNRNRVFQLVHVVCLLEQEELLESITADSDIKSETGRARCHVELANYFAAAVLMPYELFIETAERTRYDVDMIASIFGVSFEQVCHRLTTMQRDGRTGVPFFFLRVDKAGNVTKRFNATTFQLAEYGGSCPVWNIHTSFRTPGVVVPQFVELPDGERFFTISRTTDRPVFSKDTQDRRLAIALGCELRQAHRIAYAAPFNVDDESLFSPIGINCHLCPRKACSQRAHQPLFIDLPIDTTRRGNTRYES
ncbi:MAG: short-chain fatty acyl-CoA regulator family protein [Pseudomonadota bacterium]